MVSAGYGLFYLKVLMDIVTGAMYLHVMLIGVLPHKNNLFFSLKFLAICEASI